MNIDKVQGELETMFPYVSANKIKATIDMCLKLTSGYDESHDVYHHFEVAKNGFIIANELNIEDKWKVVVFYACMLHDTIDYKYPASLEQKVLELESFLRGIEPNKCDDILWVINNISYSKEHKGGYPVCNSPALQTVRDIVSDADKLEAIGDVGIVRCRVYNIATHPNATKNEIIDLMIQHFHDKLLKLKDNYIRTFPGKRIAQPKHQIMLDFVRQHTMFNDD